MIVVVALPFISVLEKCELPPAGSNTMLPVSLYLLRARRRRRRSRRLWKVPPLDANEGGLSRALRTGTRTERRRPKASKRASALQ